VYLTYINKSFYAKIIWKLIKLYGEEATSVPYDAITQELNPGIGMNEQQGTGLRGGQMTIADFLIKQQSNPNESIQTAANSMLADRLKQRTRGSVNFHDYEEFDNDKKARYNNYIKSKRAPLVNIDNTGQRGRWATDEEDSVLERLDLLDGTIGEDYSPEIKDNLDQFGLPNSFNNLFRSSDGKTYINTYNSMVADVVKDITGTASTDPEFKRLYSQMAYVTGDELADMQYKRKLLNMRVDDMYAKSGKSRPETETEEAVEAPVVEQTNTAIQSGDIEDGYIFLGGDRTKESNWRKQ